MISQARILEWVTVPSLPGDCPDPEIKSVFFPLAGRFFTTELPGKPRKMETPPPAPIKRLTNRKLILITTLLSKAGVLD